MRTSITSRFPLSREKADETVRRMSSKDAWFIMFHQRFFDPTPFICISLGKLRTSSCYSVIAWTIEDNLFWIVLAYLHEYM